MAALLDYGERVLWFAAEWVRPAGEFLLPEGRRARSLDVAQRPPDEDREDSTFRPSPI